MPRFPYLSSIFVLLSLLIGAVMVPNTAQILPSVEQIEADLSARFGGVVKIDGSMRLRFVPRPQLIIDKVSFSEKESAEALFAATIPRLVIDLDLVEMAQGRVSSAAFTLLDANVQVRLSARPVALLSRLHGVTLLPINILNGDFRVIGLDPLRPSGETNIKNMAVQLAAQRSDGPMLIMARKALPSGQMARLRLTIGAPARETEFGVSLGLGINEQLFFSGFLSGSQAAWKLDGEVELTSDNLLADAIEARLPATILPEGRRLSLSGLVRGSSSGLRADSLEIEALNTVFRARMALNWPRMVGEVPMLDGRVSTGAVNLDLLRPNFAERKQALLTGLWRDLAPDLAISMVVEATSFIIGEETGSDLSIDFEQNAQALDVRRLNLNLPFRSSLLASGRFELVDMEPAFEGSFSTRSSDTLALMLWLGNRYGVDFSAFAEAIGDAQVQRTSLVGDVKLDKSGLALNGLAGRLGDDYFSSQIRVPDLSAQRADILFNISRFDLADWGIVDGGAAARDGGLAGVGPQISRLLAMLMGAPDSQRDINFDIKIGRAFADTRRIGPAHAQGKIRNQMVQFDSLHLSSLNNADMRLAGLLHYDAAPPYGALAISVESDTAEWLRAPVFARFAPLYFNGDVASRLAVDINLTEPASDAWPKVLYSASGEVGQTAITFSMSTPARSLAYVESGTEMTLALDGAANNLAQLFFLPASYAETAQGQMQLQLTASGNDLFAIATDMALADDSLALNGTLRAAVGGKSLSGSLEFNLAQFLPFLDPDSIWPPVAASGKVQLTAAPEIVSFSGLDMNFAEGHISGEGVIQNDETQSRLNMNMAVENADLSWLLPRRAENNWGDENIRWALLGRSDADIELRATNTQLGELPLDALSGRFKLTDGVLEAPEIDISFLGGSMRANVLAEGGLLTPRFAFDGQFNDINPAKLIAEQYGNNLVDAGLSGSLRLEGRGGSARAAMSSLEGEINFEIAPGQLTFFDAVGFAEAVGAPNFAGDANALVAQFVGVHPLSFARGLGRANLRSGVVETASADFVFADGLNEARLEAAMDMVGLEIDAAFSLFPSDRQRPVIWQMTGNVGRPDVKIDASAFNSAAQAPSATPPPEQ